MRTTDGMTGTVTYRVACSRLKTIVPSLPTIFDVFDLIRDEGEAEFDQLFRNDLLGSGLQFFFVGDEFLHCERMIRNRLVLSFVSVSILVEFNISWKTEAHRHRGARPSVCL